MQLFRSEDKELKVFLVCSSSQPRPTDVRLQTLSVMVINPQSQLDEESTWTWWQHMVLAQSPENLVTCRTCPVASQSSDPIFMSLTYFVNANEEIQPSHCLRFPFTTSPRLHADTVWLQLVTDTKLSKWIFTTKPRSHPCFPSIPLLTTIRTALRPKGKK